jgi:hypothetical protein
VEVIGNGDRLLRIVIVNYSTSHLIAELLPNLPSWASVTVVDNYSSDLERRRIRDVKGFDELIELPTNGGFASGINAGALQRSADEWILLLNPDVIVGGDAISRLLEQAQQNEIDVSSPVICRKGTERVWFSGGKIDRERGVVYGDFSGLVDRNATGIHPSEFICGCAMLLSPSAVISLLPMREDLFMYWEDADLSLRAQARGMKTGVVLDSIIQHDEGGSSRFGRGGSPVYHYYMARNRLLILADYPEAFDRAAIRYTAILLLRTWAHILRRDSHRVRRCWAAFAGTFSGLLLPLKHKLKFSMRDAAAHKQPG